MALAACARPEPNRSVLAPSHARWVAIETVAPAPDADETVATVRLSLKSRWRRGGVPLYEGAETLCGVDMGWEGENAFRLVVPADRARCLRVRDGEVRRGVRFSVRTHENQAVLQRWSPDGERRLVVIEACESENWNLYLRRKGEPTYNDAMRRGWDDPDLLGGFESTQPAFDLRWTSPRDAEILVPGARRGVTLRTQAGDVRVRWLFVSPLKAQARDAQAPLLNAPRVKGR